MDAEASKLEKEVSAENATQDQVSQMLLYIYFSQFILYI